jgi:hypothetical protein
MVRNARLLLLVIRIFCFSNVIVAQEHYSPDSLMAAFEKDSTNSLKGSPITLSGIVVESRKTRVVFRSSGNDKVTCMLLPPLADGVDGPAAGSQSTVLGRIRGRGGLGNVTLDDCSIMTIPKVTEAATAVLPEIAPVTPQIPQSPSVALVPPAPPVVGETQKTVAEAVPSRKPVSIPVRPEKPSGPVTEAIPQEPEAAAEADTPPLAEQPSNPEAAVPSSPATCVCNYAYAFIGFLAGLTFLSCVKLVPVVTRSRRNDVSPTPEMRRVALETLLLKQKKR